MKKKRIKYWWDVMTKREMALADYLTGELVILLANSKSNFLRFTDSMDGIEWDVTATIKPTKKGKQK